MKKPNENLTKPPQQKLNTLLQYYQTGKYADAEKLSISITHEFPEHQFAWTVLGSVLRRTGRMNEALSTLQKCVKLDPQNFKVHYILGNTLKELGKLEEAEVSYRQAILFKSDFTEAHNNLGIVLKDLGRLKEADESYRQALVFKPDYAIAYYNLADLHRKLGKLEDAEASYREAILFKPDYEQAHYNLGVTLQELGRLDEAINAFTKAIDINPHFHLPLDTLVRLLTIYTPKEESSHPIIKVNNEIKKIYKNENISGMISDNKVIQVFCKSTDIIKENSLKLESEFSQVYRQNTIYLNCKRHKTIFNKFDIIPKFCFECYKVQVEPKSIIELIKLAIVFDQIKLVNNNTRKCLIEMRPEVSGFYKGLIYCSGLEEAYKVAEYLEVVLKENIETELHPTVKRGCSEYSISFPDYKLINKSGPQQMKYNKDWKLIEEKHDSSNPSTFEKDVPPSLFGLNLNDILIIRNWIDYAKGIGDPKVHLLKQSSLFSSSIYEIAKSRIKKFPWQT